VPQKKEPDSAYFTRRSKESSYEDSSTLPEQVENRGIGIRFFEKVQPMSSFRIYDPFFEGEKANENYFLRRKTFRNTFTISGSNWVPEPSLIISITFLLE
jgi:hypothetical protein